MNCRSLFDVHPLGLAVVVLSRLEVVVLSRLEESVFFFPPPPPTKGSASLAKVVAYG